MRRLRSTVCLLVVAELVALPAFAQQPIQNSVNHATAAVAADAARAQPVARDRNKILLGSILGVAGGTAIILGSTTLKTADATSGNAPPGSYDACVALSANPVYKANDCDVLKGPNKAVVIGGAVAAALGVTFIALGSFNSSVVVGPAGVALRHRIRF